MLDFFIVFFFCVYDGINIVNMVKKSLEKNEIKVFIVDVL